ncbi:MAG: hypothetical protein ACO2ZD_00635 [Pseudomonadales bacterium]
MAKPATAPSMQCSAEQFHTALLDQKRLIAHEINEGTVTCRRFLATMIPDGGTLEAFDDSRTYKMRRAFQCPVGYQDQSFEMDCDPLANMATGQQTAKAECGNSCSTFTTLINDRNLKEACEGVCVVDFAQGGSFEGYRDSELKLATPLRCVRTLRNYERKRIADIFSQEIDDFKKIGLDSFEYSLFQHSVEEGGANAVVRSLMDVGFPELTYGGWEGPADRPVSIHWLERYRQLIIERLQQTEMSEGADQYVLTIEMTRESWHRAKIAEYTFRRDTGGVIPGFGNNLTVEATELDELFKSQKRAFEVWEGKIRVVFNDMPIRGIFKPSGVSPTGAPLYEFVRIYPYKNEANEIGTSYVTNRDYYRNQATCDGILYDVMELIPHIHPRSYKRYHLLKALTPDGVKSAGNSWDVRLLQGSDLGDKDCPNFFGEYYRYAMRHEFRWRNIYPELSGWIVHKFELPLTYDMNSTGEVIIHGLKTVETHAVVEDIDNCNLETCANADCLDPVVCDDLVSLEPCGYMETAYCGQAHTMFLHVCRECPADVDASVEYCFVDDTAVYGTHYQVIDEAGNMLPEVGTLDWAAGESGCKVVCVSIMNALPCTPGAPAGPANCCVEEPCAPNDACFTVKLQNAVGAALGCADGTVCIKNYS